MSLLRITPSPLYISHRKGLSVGTQIHAAAFTFPAIILTTFISSSFFASQSLQEWFIGKNRHFGVRKSWAESQVQHPNWAPGLRTSHFFSLSLRSSNGKGDGSTVNEMTSITYRADTQQMPNSFPSLSPCPPTYNNWPWPLSLSIFSHLYSLTSPHMLLLGTILYTWILKSVWETHIGKCDYRALPDCGSWNRNNKAAK